jgi:WD40 repeat protein
VLTAGWDGHLRSWDAASGEPLWFVKVGPKPLSCCAFTPDGDQWVAGSMDGVLSYWDVPELQKSSEFLAHTRPVSAIVYSPDGLDLVTASWDRAIMLRKTGRERDGKSLAGHQDIVAGCAFTADGRRLLSWSYDGTLRLWDMDFASEVRALAGHADRVTAATISPDGRWAVSGGRDRQLKLWDLHQGADVGAWPQEAEVRGCYFLLDGASIIAVDSEGRLTHLPVPGMEVAAELRSRVKVMCGCLSPSGLQLALGCEDGRVRFVDLDELEQGSLIVTAKPCLKEESTILGRLLGRTRTVRKYQYTCPACRHAFESATLPLADFSCESCRRQLRIAAQVLQAV